MSDDSVPGGQGIGEGDIRRIFGVLQSREFLEHRYYQSQTRGYNVGDFYAMDHWVESGHAERFGNMFNENISEIAAACARYCGNVCRVYALHRELGRKNGIEEDELSSCPMPSAEMHSLIEKRPV